MLSLRGEAVPPRFKRAEPGHSPSWLPPLALQRATPASKPILRANRFRTSVLTQLGKAFWCELKRTEQVWRVGSLTASLSQSPRAESPLPSEPKLHDLAPRQQTDRCGYCGAEWSRKEHILSSFPCRIRPSICKCRSNGPAIEDRSISRCG